MFSFSSFVSVVSTWFNKWIAHLCSISYTAETAGKNHSTDKN